MKEVALDEEGAEIRGCRSHWVGAAVGQSHGEIARFAHGANYIGVEAAGIEPAEHPRRDAADLREPV
jgi:hypothetical protein